MASDHPAAPRDAVEFAERLLAVLDAGSFTATYKLAVLLALIDACLEGVDAEGVPPSVIRARSLVPHVLRRYWQQVQPWATSEGQPTVLRQSAMHNDLVQRIAAFRQEHGLIGTISASEARRRFPEQWAALETEVHVTIVRMPLPKLQRVRGSNPSQEFIYGIGWADEVPAARVRAGGFDDRITLLPGVAEHLVRLAPLLRPVIEQRWAAFVAKRNTAIVEEERLHRFLFGAERTSLVRVASPLRELQHGLCFYCESGLGPKVEVDHFIPWSRSADDGLDNLVAAHPVCNSRKGASLAALEHRTRWEERDVAGLDRVEGLTRWPRNRHRTLAIATAAYHWTPAGSPLWLREYEYEPLSHDLVAWRAVDQAAEDAPPSRYR